MTENPENPRESRHEADRSKAFEILTEIQRDNPQLQAVYLWGSVITGDYNPLTSDIDSIAIVDEDTDLALKERLNIELKQKLPNLKINFLYHSELNGTEKKGLTRFISSESLLYDLPSWQHVAGKIFNKADFMLGNVDLESVINSTRQTLKDLADRVIQEGREEYHAKGIARLCYLIHQRRLPYKTFCYGDLVADSDSETREVCKKIVMLKEANWSKDLIAENLQLFRNFIDTN